MRVALIFSSVLVCFSAHPVVSARALFRTPCNVCSNLLTRILDGFVPSQSMVLLDWVEYLTVSYLVLPTRNVDTLLKPR